VIEPIAYPPGDSMMNSTEVRIGMALDITAIRRDSMFGCFSGRSVNVEEVAYKKLCAIAEAANVLRKKHC